VIAVVRDAPPPLVLVRPLNVLNRWFLRSPLARPLGGLALLEFRGRRSGRDHRVPVGWHVVQGVGVVLTPAPWRANFAGGLPVTVHHRGRAQQSVGTLDRDPGAVAAALNELLSGGTNPRLLGLVVPRGHELVDAEVVELDRALIRFTPAVGG
jgi:hypothetical protein